MVQKQKQSLTKPLSKWTVWLMLAMAIIPGAITLHTVSRSQSRLQLPEEPKPSPTITAIAALGRLEPQGEVIRLSAAGSLGSARVDRILVKKGDLVRQGQVVAILDSYNTRLAALEKAQKQVLVAQAALNQVQAGAKTGDIFAQQATIARLEAQLRGEVSAQQATIARLTAELRNANRENQRYQQLYKEGAISASDADAKRLRVDTVQQQLNEAQAALNRTVETLQKQLYEANARLNSIAEIRPTDVQAAQTDVETARASVKQAHADLDLSIVRAPINGQVLKIHTRPGEVIGNAGIADLANTQQMYVVAEVYETDIKKVRPGQSAMITSNAFSGELRGTVIEIGLQVGQQNIFNNNPNVDRDNKVIDVRIRIDSPEDNRKVSTLTDLQVDVIINI